MARKRRSMARMRRGKATVPIRSGMKNVRASAAVGADTHAACATSASFTDVLLGLCTQNPSQKRKQAVVSSPACYVAGVPAEYNPGSAVLVQCDDCGCAGQTFAMVDASLRVGAISSRGSRSAPSAFGDYTPFV
eukprot:3422644-Pleurochrysis_carterae.AAC.2